MVCKKCKKAFRKDVANMEAPDEADEYCPHCDNHFLREAVTKGGVVGLSGSGTEDLRQEKYVFLTGCWTALIAELYGMIECRGEGFSLRWRLLWIRRGEWVDEDVGEKERWVIMDAFNTCI